MDLYRTFLDGIRDALLFVSFQIDTSSYVQSNEWELIGCPAVKNVEKYPCCDEPFPDLTFTIIVKRIPIFYMIILIIPCILLSLLTLVSFWLPPETPAKILLGECVTFSARQHMLSALYAIARPSVWPSARPSHGWISRKRLKLGSCNFHRTVAPSLSCLRYMFHPEIPTGSPRAGASNEVGLGKRANIVGVRTLSPGGSTS